MGGRTHACSNERPSAWPVAAAVVVLLVLVAAAPVASALGSLLASTLRLDFAHWAVRPGAQAASNIGGELSSALMEVLLGTAVLFLGAFDRRGLPATLRLRAPTPRGSTAWLALALVPLSVDVGLDSVEALVPWFTAGIDPAERLDTLTLLTGVLVAPVVEEMFFRGLLQGAVGRRWGRTPAITVSTLAFVFWHGDLGHAHTLLLAGLALAWAADVSGSIFPGMIAHALNNLLAILLGATTAGPALLQVAVLVLCAGALAASAAAVRLSRFRAKEAL